MFRIGLKVFSPRKGLIIFFCAVMVALLTPLATQAQRSKGTAEPPADNAQPALTQFKGLRIGMAADEARKKLGNPRDKSAEQDFYVFNDNEAVQVNYDKNGSVNAIAIDFMSGANGAPTAKDILGVEPDAKADGSVYKMVRYPKAGFWVSYSRTAGNDPTVTIIMQKIQ
jgi:hypothetical protein